MNKVYIFGHKKPDTDSVMSAIALSYLKNKLGEEAEPRILGDINKETKFALDYFGFNVPKYLNDVKLKLKNINYHKGFFLKDIDTLYDAYQKMLSEELTAIPLVKEDNEFLGLITIKDLSRTFFDNDRKLYTSYDNLLKVLNATEVVKTKDEFNANILDLSYTKETLEKMDYISSDTAIIMDDRSNMIDYAISRKVSLIVLVGDKIIEEDKIALAKENNVDIIHTIYDSYDTLRLINLANYTKVMADSYNTTKFSENDYVDSVLDINKRLRHTNYPIVSKHNKCLGLLRITDLNDKERKKVILVDHNDKYQSADGIEQAEILEIVDHHNLGNLTTNAVVNFTNMAVGSTCTIVYTLFKRNNIDIPKDIAGLMLSGILSDTLILKSPTTTSLDIDAVRELSRIAGIDYEEYGLKLISSGTSIDGMSKENILYNDFKVYNFSGSSFGIGQFFTTNFEEIKKELDEYIKVLDEVASANNYDIVALYVTDIIRDGSYILFNTKAKEKLQLAYSIDELHEGAFIKGCLSRKKDIVPIIMDYFES